MSRSLRTRLVLVMLLLIILMMTVVGAFLVNGVANYHLNTFHAQMKAAFSDRPDFVGDLRAAADSNDPPSALSAVLRTYSGLLGIDSVQRNYYVLDAHSGSFLSGSDDEKGEALSREPTTAILTVLADNNEIGLSRRASSEYMDIAVPISGTQGTYIIYVKDTKDSLQNLISQLFYIILQSLFIGVVLAMALSLLLSKAITAPLERLTHGAQRMASGTFIEGLSVESDDEIGVLTRTFNNMALELQRTLEEIGSERDKLGTLFLHMTDGMASFARDGTPIQANPAAERLLGCHFSEMGSYGQVLGALAPLVEVLSLTEEPRFLQRNCEMGGRRLLVSLAPFGHETTEGILAVLHDVTEQHTLDELRREFVSNVSHELRTPLTNIHSYAETLLDNETLPTETTRSFTQVILNESERMNRIVRDLLTLSRFDYGKMDWHITWFDLDEMLRGIHQAMHLEAKRLNHTLTLTCVPAPLRLSSDRERLEQVITNILSNAFKYTPPGGQIQMTAEQRGHVAHITVRDNGIGIPKSDLPHLFERFYRVDKDRSRRSGGTGLGLSIARKIVEGLNGSIELESVAGEGTTVTVTLPTEKQNPCPSSSDD